MLGTDQDEMIRTCKRADVFETWVKRTFVVLRLIFTLGTQTTLQLHCSAGASKFMMHIYIYTFMSLHVS